MLDAPPATTAYTEPGFVHAVQLAHPCTNVISSYIIIRKPKQHSIAHQKVQDNARAACLPPPTLPLPVLYMGICGTAHVKLSGFNAA